MIFYGGGLQFHVVDECYKELNDKMWTKNIFEYIYMPRIKGFQIRSNPAAQDSFRLTRHKIQEDGFAKLARLMSGTFINLKTTVVDNYLASASLMTNYYQHLMIRNGEVMSQSFIRKIMGILDAKHSAWKYSYDQKVPKAPQYEEAIKKLELTKKCLEAKLKVYDTDNEPEEVSQTKAQILKAEETINRMRLILEFMEPNYQGSMHPDPGAVNFNDESIKGNFLVGPNSPWRIRGMLIRIAGASKGQRAQSWKKYAGSYSINSVGFVNSEESKVQMITKQGTYGLTVRIVWEKTDSMPGSDLVLSPDGGISYYEPFRLPAAV